MLKEYSAKMQLLNSSKYAIIIYMSNKPSEGYRRHVGKAFDIKTKASSILSLLIGVAITVFYGVGAIVYRSVWYAALSGYYATMIVFRAAVLFANLKCAVKFRGDETGASLYKWRIFLGSGIFLLVTDIAMSFAIGQTVLGNSSKSGIVMTIGTSVYTVYKIILSAVNAVKAGRFADPVTQALRNLNVAASFMSVVSLTAALCSMFGNDDSFNKITVASVGGAAILIVLVISVVMTVRAAVNISREKKSAV